jgi:nucleotide-binding universal stress UspA family protein
VSTSRSEPTGLKVADDGSRPRSRIVVGIDGSEGARAGLVWAMGEAARRGDAVEVLSAVPVETWWGDPLLVDAGRVEAARADTERRARALVDEVRRDPAVVAVPGASDVPVQVVVHAGPAAELLLHQAEGADLLVVGSRGRGGVRSTLPGSVALHCAAHAAPCAVVVVHGLLPAAAGVGKVVVGLDDSDMARAALSAALAHAARSGARIEAMVAYERPNYWSDLYAVMAPPAGETEEHARRRAEQILGEAPADVADGERPEVRVLAVEGPPGPALVRQSEGAGLLVVGSRSRTQLRGMALGSAALYCVLHATVPVMVVHPDTAVRPTAPLAASARG